MKYQVQAMKKIKIILFRLFQRLLKKIYLNNRLMINFSRRLNKTDKLNLLKTLNCRLLGKDLIELISPNTNNSNSSLETILLLIKAVIQL